MKPSLINSATNRVKQTINYHFGQTHNPYQIAEDYNAHSAAMTTINKPLLLPTHTAKSAIHDKDSVSENSNNDAANKSSTSSAMHDNTSAPSYVVPADTSALKPSETSDETSQLNEQLQNSFIEPPIEQHSIQSALEVIKELQKKYPAYDIKPVFNFKTYNDINDFIESINNLFAYSDAILYGLATKDKQQNLKIIQVLYLTIIPQLYIAAKITSPHSMSIIVNIITNLIIDKASEKDEYSSFSEFFETLLFNLYKQHIVSYQNALKILLQLDKDGNLSEVRLFNQSQCYKLITTILGEHRQDFIDYASPETINALARMDSSIKKKLKSMGLKDKIKKDTSDEEN